MMDYMITCSPVQPLFNRLPMGYSCEEFQTIGSQEMSRNLEMEVWSR